MRKWARDRDDGRKSGETVLVVEDAAVVMRCVEKQTAKVLPCCLLLLLLWIARQLCCWNRCQLSLLLLAQTVEFAFGRVARL